MTYHSITCDPTCVGQNCLCDCSCHQPAEPLPIEIEGCD